MNRILTLTGIGAAVGAAAIAGGLGVAFAHDNHPSGHRMMDGAAMPMPTDSATMSQHMNDVLGADLHGRMQDAMKAALGADGYQQMLNRMATGCPQAGMGMVTPGTAADPAAPGHAGHHPATPAAN